MSHRAVTVARTRERLLSVAREHFVTRPYDEVTLGEIAREAGVAQQTLLNHFSSKDGLFLAFTHALQEEVHALRGAPKPRDAPGAARAVVRQYERLGDANVRLAHAAERIPALAEAVAQARRQHQAWLEDVFRDQLPTDPSRRRHLLAQLYVATDVHTWHLLRRELARSRTETTTVIESMIRAVLGAVGAKED